jgi:hypothetical protein
LPERASQTDKLEEKRAGIGIEDLTEMANAERKMTPNHL